MEILQGAAIGLKLRQLSDSARRRVWIVSPYIGRWSAVSALLGANWWLSSTVLWRVITDIDNPKNVNRALAFFGTSSVQELLGSYYPDEYPIRNSNSDAGIRFFGYRV
jgi:hypothetical protein